MMINNGMLAKRSIQTLLKEFHGYLFDDFVPFMDRHVIDHQLGGFCCNTNRLGGNLDTNKRTWYDGRGIWVYSYLYNHIEKKPEYLKVARDTVELVLKTKSVDTLLWPWEYDREGNNLMTDEPDIYGNLFVAEGLAEYSVAVNDDTYWNMAKGILMQCYELYEQPDYLYKLQYSPTPSVTHASRVLGHSMIMLRLSTSLLRLKEDSELDRISSHCINALLRNHYNPEFNLMVELLNHDYSNMGSQISQFVYIGHAIESLWMVMDECVRRNDEALFNEAMQRFKFHVEVAWDDVYGGVFHCIDNVWENKWLTDKVLWAQHEVLVGLLIILEQRPEDSWAVHWFDKMYNYVLETFPLSTYGFSLWNIGGDRKMSFVAEGIRIENYHHPRFLMLGIQKLDQIQQKIKLIDK